MKYKYNQRQPRIATKDKVQLLIIWGLVLIAGTSLWIAYSCWTKPKYKPQQTSVANTQPARLQPISQIQLAEVSEIKPIETPKPQVRTIPGGVDEYGTPYPAVQAVPQTSYHRADGFDNMCFFLNGYYGVAVVKDYNPADGWWPYLGEVDPSTGSAANAKESEAWCQQHQP